MFEAHLQVRLFFLLLLLIVITTSLDVAVTPSKYHYKTPYNNYKIKLLLLFCLLFIGFREWWVEEVFVDSIRYAYSYEHIKFSDLKNVKDFGFSLISILLRNVGIPTTLFFLICAFLYIYPLFLVANKLNRKYSYIIFLVIISSFSFFDYGVNIIRNGIATSFLLLAIIYYKNKRSYLLMALGVSFHLSVFLPIICFLLARFLKKTTYYLLIWIIALFLFHYFMDYFKGLFLGIELVESRANRYLTTEASIEKFSRIGIRWDFISYRLLPILIGVYFIYKRKLENQLYHLIFNTYLLTNSIWILINDIPYSNRVAYLSWFLIPIIVIYPFFLPSNIKNKFIKLSLTIFLYFLFTFTLLY